MLDALAESLRGERLDLLRLRMLDRRLGPAQRGLVTGAGAPSPPLRAQDDALGRADSRLDGRVPRRQVARAPQERAPPCPPAGGVYGDGLKIRFFASPADLDGLYEACVRVHRTSYQHTLGVGFSSDERRRRLTELSMRKGWYLAGVLFLRGEPVAFQLGTAYRGT